MDAEITPASPPWAFTNSPNPCETSRLEISTPPPTRNPLLLTENREEAAVSCGMVRVKVDGGVTVVDDTSTESGTRLVVVDL